MIETNLPKRETADNGTVVLLNVGADSVSGRGVGGGPLKEGAASSAHGCPTGLWAPWGAPYLAAVLEELADWLMRQRRPVRQPEGVCGLY